LKIGTLGALVLAVENCLTLPSLSMTSPVKRTSLPSLSSVMPLTLSTRVSACAGAARVRARIAAIKPLPFRGGVARLGSLLLVAAGWGPSA
jgi:hypothetical protein